VYSTFVEHSTFKTSSSTWSIIWLEQASQTSSYLYTLLILICYTDAIQHCSNPQMTQLRRWITLILTKSSGVKLYFRNINWLYHVASHLVEVIFYQWLYLIYIYSIYSIKLTDLLHVYRQIITFSTFCTLPK